MFLEPGMFIKVTNTDDSVITGTIYRYTVQLCEDDNNRPHAAMFLTQDERFIEEEGSYGCVALWVEKIKQIEILNLAK